MPKGTINVYIGNEEYQITQIMPSGGVKAVFGDSESGIQCVVALIALALAESKSGDQRIIGIESTGFDIPENSGNFMGYLPAECALPISYDDYYDTQGYLDLNVPNISPSEAIYGFVAWLTKLEESVTFSANHDAALAAELASEFCEANGLPDPVEFNHVMPETRKLYR